MRIPASLEVGEKPAGIQEYLGRRDTGKLPLRSLLWNFFSIGLEFPGPLLKALLSLVLSSVCIILVPRMVMSIIDDALLVQDYPQLWAFLSLLALAECGRFIGFVGQTYFFSELGQRSMQVIRVRLFERFLRLPLSTIDRTPHGALVTRLTTDVAYLAEMFQMGFVQVAKDGVTVVVAVVGMLLLDVQLTLLVLLGFPLLFMFARHMTPRLFRAHREVRRLMTACNALLTDALSASSVVCLLNVRGLFSARASWIAHAIADAQLQRVRANALFHPFTTLITAAGACILFIVGALRIEDGTLKIGALVAFLSYLIMIFWPLVHAVNRLDVFLSGLASLERIFDALSWPIEDDEIEADRAMRFQGEIEFRNVWFAYEAEDWVLRDVSFRIPKGAHVGIVGPTGSGKSTLVNLLLRFYEPQRGSILVDVEELSTLSKQVVRERFGIVHQDAYVFPGTLRENIALWQEDSSAQVEKVLTHSAFSILGEPERELESGGTNISAGMRQLLSFARNLYREPDVWILDEATAHLDPELDEQLNRLLEEFGAANTAFIIAHRLSSVQECAHILVLQSGELREQGDHAALMAQGGLYAHLHAMQEQSMKAAS